MNQMKEIWPVSYVDNEDDDVDLESEDIQHRFSHLDDIDDEDEL